MNKYEMLTIFNASLTDEEKENMVKKYSEMMTSDGGKLLTMNKWGVKKLAYPINFKREGYYVLFEFEANAEVPAKISALMNIDENVLRSLCLKQDVKETKSASWLFFAILSAVFAALVSLFVKIGLKGIPSNLGTLYRTIIVFKIGRAHV